MLLAGDLEVLKAFPANPPTSTGVDHIFAMGDTVFFSADDGVHGAELWKSDGTASGTVMVKDVVPGPSSSFPYALSNVGGMLFIVTRNGNHNTGLLISDGTGDGTFQVDMNGGEIRNSVVDVDGTAFFWVDEGVSRELALWKSNGTAEGTGRVASLPLSAGSKSGLVMGGKFYHLGRNRGVGPQITLWRSDGTEAGTVPVADIPGSRVDGLRSGAAAVVGDRLFFSVHTGPTSSSLWTSDGTTAGTTEVMAFPNATSLGSQFQDLNGAAYFTVTHESSAVELWSSNGTTAGTARVAVLGSDVTVGFEMRALDGRLFFTVDDELHGKELWASDGTTAGTGLLKDIHPGTDSSNPEAFASVGDTLYFRAAFRDGRELWKSDGTPEGTVLVKRGTYFPDEMTPVEGGLYFVASTGASNPNEVWYSDGTNDGTVPIRLSDGSPAVLPRVLTRAGSRLFLGGGNSYWGSTLYSLVWDEEAISLGDYDDSGLVDGGDFLVWQLQHGTIAFPPASGADGTANGVIDADDLTVWQTSYGSTADAITAGELVRDAALATESTESTPSDADLTALAIAVATPAVQQGAGDDLDARPVHRHATAPAVGLSTDLDLRRLAVRTALPTDDSLMGPLTASNNEKTAASAGRRPGQVAHDWGPSITTSLGI